MIFIGNQAAIALIIIASRFESDVIFIGNQAHHPLFRYRPKFESDVFYIVYQALSVRWKTDR